MNIPVKKLQNGFEIPVYGFGLWLVGGKREPDTSKDEEEIATLREAIELGVTHFDTAEGYAAGHSEEILGEAIQGYDRSKLFIATKVSENHQTPEGIREAITASLAHLKTDYVDLYMLHAFPNPGISIEAAIKTLNELVDEGLVKHIGVSNFTVKRFEEAKKYSKHPLVVNQLHYNVQYREVEKAGLVKYSQENDVMLVAWRPLQKAAIDVPEIITKLATKYDKTPFQIMLNWLISQKNVVTIAKTSSVEHLKENLGALGWKMEESDIELIRKDFPNQQFVSDAVPLEYPGDISAY